MKSQFQSSPSTFQHLVLWTPGVQEKPVSRPYFGLSGLRMNFCAWTLCWNLYEIITATHGAHQKTETDYRLVYWLIEFNDVNNDMHCTLKGQHKS